MKFKGFSLFIIVSVLLSISSACVKELKPLPKAEFAYTSSTSCALPLIVSFQNHSKNATVFRWDFGDGSPVNHHENPIHTYSSEGVYTVMLTSYGEGGTDEVAEVIYAVSTPVASISATDTVVYIGDSVQFFSTINSTLPATYLWSFGDGYTSHLESPLHAYTYPGVYTVVLTVTNACGSTYVTVTDYITVNTVGSPPFPDFMASQTSVNTGASINFTDLSVNNPQTWEWTFDSAIPNTSNLQHPSNIVYNTPGVYDVSLKVGNVYGDSTVVKTGYIHVYASASGPIANFTANSTNIIVGNSINFSDLSLNNPTSWQWSFPGGMPNSSTSQNPSNITYNASGTYNVTLTATNSLGNDTHTKQAYITVNPSAITSAQIIKITVESMPFPTSPPYFRNPYYRITTPTNVILLDGRSEYQSGITGFMMPVFWDLNPYFVINNFNLDHKVRIFDWRTNPSMDIFVGDVVFKLSNYTGQPNPYPPSITLLQNNMRIKIDLIWQ